MFRSWFRISLLAILLIVSVIAPNGVGAATAPAVAALAPIDAVGLDAPQNLAVDGSGNVYVTDSSARAVFKFDQYGRKRSTFVVPGFAPEGLAVTADGTRLYVSGSSSVLVVNGVTGASLGSIGSGFGRVGEVALDEAGFIFVSDRENCRVVVFNAAGEQQAVFGSKGTADGQFMDIQALTVNTFSQEVLVADSLLSNGVSSGISVFKYDGTFVRKLLAASAFGGGVTQFGGIAVDLIGRLYIPDLITPSMRILGPDYLYLSRYNNPLVEGNGSLVRPTDSVFDAVTGRLFVVNSIGRVEVFGIDGATSPIFVNHAPAVPVPLSPVAGSEIGERTPTLVWQNAADVDGDVLTYSVKLTKAGVSFEKTGIAGQAGANTTYRLNATLDENQLYNWSVRSSDGTALSVYSEEQTFVVNATEEAPVAGALLSPVNQEVVAGSSVISWQAATDPDPEDTITYLVEVATDPSFQDIVAESETSALSVTLGALTGYQSLVDGGVYFWRVVAVDNHGLSTSFDSRVCYYDTSLLKVTANVPGAVVSFGGNHAYAGKRIGTVPLELRDLPTGSLTVVVERKGFEPWIKQINLAERQNVIERADLRPALNPRPFKANVLSWDGTKTVAAVAGNVAPFAVDFDNDGFIDIVTGDASGRVMLYRGMASEAQPTPAFASRELLLRSVSPGLVPFVVDWNNDGKKDLLLGNSVGAVSVCLNRGSETQPRFAAEKLLKSAGAPLNVGTYAVPVVMDLDGDGDKDLVVANGAGMVTGFLNINTDEQPVLAEGKALLPKLAGRTGLATTDWNADGRRDLVAVNGTTVSVYIANRDGSFNPTAISFVPTTTAAVSIFAADLDSVGGKDLLLGLESGSVKLLRATGTTPLRQFTLAMQDVVNNLITEAQSSGVLLPASIDTVNSALVAEDLDAARTAALSLVDVQTGDATVDQLLSELKQLLR